MDDKWRKLFDDVRAEEDLKENTRRFLSAEIKKQRRKPGLFVPSRLVALAASFVMFVALGTVSAGMFFTASAYVDIDVNPSIELTVNRFGRVISANPYNEDGAKLLAAANVKYASYENAVAALLGAAAENGYIYNAKLLSVTLQANNSGSKNDMLSKLQTAVDSSLSAHHSNAQSEVFPVSEEVKGHAHAQHVTPAKYLAIEELQAVDPTANFDECAEHSISEIKELTESHHEGSGGHHREGVENGQVEQPAGDDANCDDDNEGNAHGDEHG